MTLHENKKEFEASPSLLTTRGPMAITSFLQNTRIIYEYKQLILRLCPIQFHMFFKYENDTKMHV